MSLNNKNPISPIVSIGNLSVPSSVTYGTNFSVLGTGGFMEVFSLNDLNYVIPIGQTGLIEFTGNTIPIQFNKGTGSIFSPDVLTLHSDNISSGRRKLGMLVYVYETNKIYQHTIDDYELLWTAATNSSGPGGPTIIISEFGTTVKNNSTAGQNFINAWTASTIEGISGYTNLNATWRVLQTGGGGGAFTGGTVTGNTTFTSGLTANIFSASTYLGLPSDIFITGGTFDTNTDTLSLERSSGTPITITGITDYYTTGFTYNDNTFTILDNSGNTFPVTVNTFTGLTANTISATTYQNLPIDPDTYVTGFTYSANTFSITNNSGTTLNATINEVTGFTVNGIFNVSGATSTFTNSAPNSTVAQFYIGSSGSVKFFNANNISKYISINENGIVGANIGNGANSFTIYGASSSVAVNAEGGSPVYLQNGVQFSTGNVIIGSLADPGYKLFVSGNTLVTGTTVTQNFRMTSGATNGYVLLSDSLGNGIWSPQSGITNVPISGITGLQSELNNKYDKSGGTVNGDVVVTGNVTILGTATTINTETLSVEDNLITLNSNYTGSTVPFFGDSGIEILRGSATTASLIWNESSQYWQAGLTGTTKQIILSGDSLSLLNSGHTHPISEIDNLQSSLNNKLDLTGGTLNGDLSLVNLSANTITATTIDLCANNGTLYTDSISGCSPINILSTSIFNDGLSANTISGGTLYGDGSNLTGIAGGFTGGTVTGSAIFTSGLTSNTISATTINGGTFSGDGSGLTNINTSGPSTKLFNYYNFI